MLGGSGNRDNLCMSSRVLQFFDLVVTLTDDLVIKNNHCTDRNFTFLVCFFCFPECQIHPIFVILFKHLAPAAASDHKFYY